MATLHVRGVPDDLYAELAESAGERGSSITAETIRLLSRALSMERRGQPDLLARIRTERESVRRGAPSAADLIRAERER